MDQNKLSLKTKQKKKNADYHPPLCEGCMTICQAYCFNLITLFLILCFSSSTDAGTNSANEVDSADPSLVPSSSSFLSSRHLSVSQSLFASSSLPSQPPPASPRQSANLWNQLGSLERARVGVFFSFFLFLPSFCSRVAVLTCCCPLKKELKSQHDHHLSGLSGWVMGGPPQPSFEPLPVPQQIPTDQTKVK